MKDFEVWKSYIDALDVLTNQYSEPFEIKVLESKNDASVICRYVDENHKHKIWENLIKVFPGLKQKDINFQSNYLLYPAYESIIASKLEDLKAFAESNHFEFSSKPAFSGTFKYNKTPLIDFLKEHVIKESYQKESSLIQHINNLYPKAIFKEKNRGKIVVLDETLLKDKTFANWKDEYKIEYLLSVKKIEEPIEIPKFSSKVNEIAYSKSNKKLNLRLAQRITLTEVEEIRLILAQVLKVKLGIVPEIVFKTVFTKNKEQKLTKNHIPKKRNLSNFQLLTLDELESVDTLLEENQEVYREEYLGAVFKIDISQTFIEKQFEIAEKYLHEKIGLSHFMVEGFYKQIHLVNMFLNKEMFMDFQENTFYSNSFHRVSYIIDPIVFKKFEQTRKSKKIYYKSEDTPNLEGVILPNPDQNIFVQTFSASVSLSDLKFEVYVFLNTLKRYFKREVIKVIHEHIFRIDKQRFFEHLKDIIPYEDFQISSDAETISFNFKTKNELDEKLQKLESYSSLNYLKFGTDHKYKVTFGNTTPLTKLKEKLDKLNFAKAILSKSGNELKVFGLMSDSSLLPIVRANIENVAGNYEQENIQLNWDAFNKGFVKYYFHFDEESYKEEVHKKLNNLKGEPLSLEGESTPLGVLKSVAYPNLTLLVEDKAPLNEGANISVRSALKGEKDKVKRLREAIEKIYSKSENSISNNNLKTALIDASVLESFIEGDITRTKEFKDLFQKVSNDLLSPFVNQRQKEAIVKCLLSEDLFIVQGPPGTGKSTAIAELIWQHLANNEQEDRYRILVTSETNLAVDNALDKLRSKSHLLIKPIRFGSEEKLDAEGRRYSLEALNRWKNKEWESEETLIVDDWVELINSRCENPKNEPFLNQWKEHLTEKKEVLRNFVHHSYINNCNVIGATCSSIGKINSEGRFTRFFMEFSDVFFKEDLELFKANPSRVTKEKLSNNEIAFDLIIQDEASKASPPELALPFTFGKKAVIIGDHRQLPPLIDTNEFIESLTHLKDRSNEQAQIKKVGELIRFIKRNREDFEHSHFEKLFKGIDPNLKSTFDTQYRMHPAINETIKQFYKGDFEEGKDLECGLPMGDVDDPNLDNVMSRYHGVTPKKDTHVMWVDVQTPEIKKGTSRTNPGEVKAIEWLINNLTANENYKDFINHWKKNEREQKELGVITFYGAQAGLIKKSIPKGVEVRVSPVDRFQGMERNIVIVSLVRSDHLAENENQLADFEEYDNDYGFQLNESLGFAESPNRLNVALSRAKRLLIIVGNSKHFSKKEIYKNVFETIKNNHQGEVWGFDGEKPVKI